MSHAISASLSALSLSCVSTHSRFLRWSVLLITRRLRLSPRPKLSRIGTASGRCPPREFPPPYRPRHKRALGVFRRRVSGRPRLRENLLFASLVRCGRKFSQKSGSRSCALAIWHGQPSTTSGFALFAIVSSAVAKLVWTAMSMAGMTCDAQPLAVLVPQGNGCFPRSCHPATGAARRSRWCANSVSWIRWQALPMTSSLTG
jgi:hypothetical protein